MFFNLKNLIWLLFIFLYSCGINEPESYFEKNTDQPEIRHINFNEIQPGQHIAGTIYLHVDLELIEFEVAKVVLYIDGQIVNARTNYKNEFILNTREFQGGEHEISIGFIAEESNLGLLNLIEYPTIIFTETVFFDQTPPTPVILNAVTYQGMHPELIWSENQDENFFAYVIERRFHPNYSYLQEFTYDTIFNRSTTTFVDTSFKKDVGLKIKYRIVSSNRADTSGSNMQSIQFSSDIPNTSTVKKVYPAERSDVIYFKDGSGTIRAYNGSTSTINNSLYTGHLYNFGLNYEETKIYVDFNTSMFVLNATTFSRLDTLEGAFAEYCIYKNIFGLPNNRICIIENSGNYWILDDDTYEIISTSSLGMSSVNEFLIEYNSDRSVIYIGHDSYTTNEYYSAKIGKFHLEGNLYVLDCWIDIGEELVAMAFDEDQDQLFFAHDRASELQGNQIDYVTVLNSESLEEINQIPIPLNLDLSYTRIKSMTLVGQNIFVSYRHDDEGYSLRGKIDKFDKNTYQFISSIKCHKWANILTSTKINGYLYIFYNPNIWPSEGWSITTDF